MPRRRIFVPLVLVLLVVSAVGLYLNPELLQGRFSSNQLPSSASSSTGPSTSSTSTGSGESPVKISFDLVASVSGNDTDQAIFVDKDSLSGSGANDIELKMVKNSGDITACHASYAFEYQDTMYPLSNDTYDFLDFLDLTVTKKMSGGNEVQIETDEWAPDTAGRENFDSLMDMGAYLTDGDTVLLKLDPDFDSGLPMDAAAGDRDTYEENTLNLYMSSFDCVYRRTRTTTKSGTVLQEDMFTWDVGDTEGENKYFRIPDAVDGKGFFIQQYVIGSSL